jgi:hypothetical protein
MAQELRKRGVDAEGVSEAGRRGFDDDDQLAHAVAHSRVMVTCNRLHFDDLSTQYFLSNMQHCGIVLAPQYEFGEMLRRLIRLCEIYDGEDLRNQTVYLQSVK